MFDIHYEVFVITYYTSGLAKQILSTLCVKFVRLSHAIILVYITGLSFCQVSPFLPPWSGYWVIKINFIIKQFYVQGRYKT